MSSDDEASRESWDGEEAYLITALNGYEMEDTAHV